ncbi:Syntaxin [Schistosoma japonicum]|nr:Syntaxin [Schistosoma japonicum]KAH8860328.1 Syntaxin [Schistosoma japonicum]
MVKDRLPELEARIKVRNNSKPKNNEENDFSQLNSDFFDQVNELHADIDNLQQDINAVDRLQKDILARLDNQLNELTNSIRLRAHKIRSSLKELELQEDGKLLSEMSGKYRLKSSQHAAISRQFVFIMNNYSRLQVDYRDKCKARIRTKLLVGNFNFHFLTESKYFLAQVSFSEDEVEKMLEKNHTGIFTQAIMAETEAAKRSLSDIEARHADIIRLEKSIQEMRDLFFNVALLVDQQGDLIDQVEYNLNKASDCIVNSKRTLSSTVIRNRKNRRYGDFRQTVR